MTEKTFFPVVGIFAFGWETLAYMLLGMAALKSGLLTGAWDNRRYLRWALVGARHRPAVLPRRAALPVPLGIRGARGLHVEPSPLPRCSARSWSWRIACLIILATRRGGALIGAHRGGRPRGIQQLSRHVDRDDRHLLRLGPRPVRHARPRELALIVIAAWAVMLLWSKPWLERFRYGPLEWAWRSLTLWRVQPFRR